MRRPWTIAAALLALVMLGPPGAAQPLQDFEALDGDTPTPRLTSERDVLAIGARFGLGGVWTLERFAPMRVLLDGGGRAFSGVLEVSYRQDVTQETVQRVPFAVTPNAISEIEVIVCPSSDTERIQVVARDERGRRLGGRDFSQRGRNGTQLPLGARENGPLIVSMTDSRVELGLDAWARRLDGNGDPVMAGRAGVRTSDPWAAVRVAPISADDLPRSWAGLDAASALIVRAEQVLALDADAAEAIEGWLHAGGTLVVLADGIGPEYRQWPGVVGRDVVGRYVVAAAPAPLAVDGQEVRAILDQHALRTSGVEIDGDDPSDQLVPVSETTGRALRLTETGVRTGWRLRWLAGADTGLLAEGPLGLGWVVVLGIDPADLATGPRADVVAASWTNALSIFDGQSWETSGWWGGWGSGARPAHSRAISGAIEATLRVSPVGMGVAILLLAGGLVLVLLVGPIDAIVLHRLRLSHRSWLTAIGWIVLAAGAALAYPRLVRDGGGVLARYEAVDARLDDTGPRASVRTAVTSVYAGRTGPIRYADPPAGSWMRGVSTQMYGGSGVTSLPTLRMGQFRLAGTDATRRTGWPGLGLPEDDAGRDAAQRMWTLRTVMDSGPAGDVPLPACRVVVEPEARVRIDGVPAAARAISIAVRHGEQWFDGGRFDLVAEPLPDGAVAADLVRSPGVPAAWDAANENFGGGTRTWYGPNLPVQSFAASSLLPGAIRRGVAIDRLTEDGANALVLLAIEHAEPLGPGGLTVEPTGRANRLTVMRLVVPVDGDADGEGGRD